MPQYYEAKAWNSHGIPIGIMISATWILMCLPILPLNCIDYDVISSLEAIASAYHLFWSDHTDNKSPPNKCSAPTNSATSSWYQWQQTPHYRCR